MVFSDPNFLFLFLPVTVGVYFILPGSWRNGWLLLTSWAFYFAGGGVLIVLLLVSTVLDYTSGMVAGRGVVSGNRRLVNGAVFASAAGNLGLLAYYKYANFFVEQVNGVRGALGSDSVAWTSVVLPIGISFYTFQTMSYTIDVARGRVGPLRNPVDFAMYVTLFPQLIAGPIVRYHEIASEMTGRRVGRNDFAEGVLRFAHGLAKKIIVADSVAAVADAAFKVDPTNLTTASAWLGVLAYTVQIYFDFSGYSDMAIGLGRMFGFHFPENFRRPYSALSITDFWRRWHITLSNWFRDYLYIPLGGSQGGTSSTYRNLVIVFLLTGLWHGAAWTFVFWGAYHGLLLVVERVAGIRRIGPDARPSRLQRWLTLLAVIVGWVFFRAEGMAQAFGILEAMFTWSGLGLPAELAVVLTTRAQLGLLIGVGTFFLPRAFVSGLTLLQSRGRWIAAGRLALVLMGLPYALALAATGTFSPFLYYQF